MAYEWTMIRVDIHEAKARLSEYLARLGEGDVLVICKRNTRWRISSGEYAGDPKLLLDT